MTSRLAESEFAVLRQTIASRGTTRMVLLPVTFVGWATLTIVLLLFSQLPVAALLPLINTGPGEDSDCARLLSDAREKPKAPPPGKTQRR